MAFCSNGRPHSGASLLSRLTRDRFKHCVAHRPPPRATLNCSCNPRLGYDVIPKNSDRHIWEFAWVRDLVLLALLGLIVTVAVLASHLTIPFAMGITVAYAVQPVIARLHRWRVPRWLTALLLVLALVGLTAAALTYVLPDLYDQVMQLAKNAPGYVDRLLGPIGVHWADVDKLLHPPKAAPKSTVASAASLQNVGEALAHWTALGMGVVSVVLGATIDALVGLLIFAITFVTVSSHFNELVEWISSFIPPDRHKRVVEIAARMDRSVAGNLRGRLVQAVFLAVVLCIGWNLAGVRYWLLLGLFIGALNLVPYIAIVGAPLVLLFNWLDKAATGEPMSFGMTFALPVAIHLCAQFVDGWIVEPLVQSKATNLNGITILLSVMTGGTLFGVIGMVAAVPFAACIKILGEEVLVPALRQWLRGASKHVA
jgi:predicted PurR-regulated permease PerM